MAKKKTIENSGNNIAARPESSRTYVLDGRQKPSVSEVSKGQFGKTNNTINRIVHNQERIKPIPEEKKNLVLSIAAKLSSSQTVLLASTKGLPSSQFQSIKKKLRGKAEIVVAKKTIVLRAIAETKKGTLQNLKAELTSDIALMFSALDVFELASLLADYQSPTKAKVGDISPEDITIEQGPTELVPGPAISELGAVGLKVAVENGKLTIKQGATIVKKGEPINEKVNNVLGKLKIMPMKVGFIPLAAYDAKSDQIYKEIKIDKTGTLAALRTAITQAVGLTIKIGYITSQNIKFLLAKASRHERALQKFIKTDSNNDKEDK